VKSIRWKGGHIGENYPRAPLIAFRMVGGTDVNGVKRAVEDYQNLSGCGCCQNGYGLIHSIRADLGLQNYDYYIELMETSGSQQGRGHEFPAVEGPAGEGIWDGSSVVGIQVWKCMVEVRNWDEISGAVVAAAAGPLLVVVRSRVDALESGGGMSRGQRASDVVTRRCVLDLET